MDFRAPLKIKDLISLICNKQDKGVSYCIYGRRDMGCDNLDAVCYLDSYPEITDDYDEVYSDFVLKNDLELWFREELVQDVVFNVLGQKPKASFNEILVAINYYAEKDCFMNLES